MNWIAQTFSEFGRSIGLAELDPGPNGLVSLEIGLDRRLDFKVLEEAVLMFLGRPLGADKLLCLRRALDTCHQRHGWSLPVRAGLTRDGRLVFIVRLAAREFRPNTIEQAFDLLSRLHDRVSA